ncbi:MAG: cytochrome P450 [Hamadaea sp.]|nr:cytochrome P450 [Hamadaea sp.]NUR48438.1 cytochrome P450 [Hamadaea sp.]NUT08447.1 cytochrome P450 [Hamadaea sp.]
MIGDLWRWTRDPIPLLTERAATAPVFELRLWRRGIVGYRPEWNRAVLGDLAAFRAAGSLSGLTPYLSGGVVHADVPEHDERRRVLNPHFHNRSLAALLGRLDEVAARYAPPAEFEALEWAADVVRRLLNAAFFGGRVPDRLLRSFLVPLHRPMPHPLLPRPRLFRRVDEHIAAVLADPPPGTLAAALTGLPDAVEEIRVALAAGYDTTTHSLAWAAWQLAGAPEWRTPDALPAVLDEVLRLYPAGWIGSRVAAADVSVAGADIPAGTLVLYSPYLTHRDPELWPDPGAFRPERFTATGPARPAWGFLPFSAGRRTCLGAHLARAMLGAALRPCLTGRLSQVSGDPTPQAGLTLRPRGPLRMIRPPR